MFARQKIRNAVGAALFAIGITAWGNAGAGEPPIRIGVDADLSTESAQSGEAIRRGAAVAVAEINAAGGVLGRPLELIVLDHRGIPSRGLDNIEILSTMTGLVAVIGGIQTPVAEHQLPALHKYDLIYVSAWASGTHIVENGFDPNFVFRVAVRDSIAGAFLVNAALDRGYRRPALLLMETGWGRSNEKAMTAALASRGLEPAAVEWFRWGAKSLAPQIERISRAGADVILLVAGVREGSAAIRDMAERPADERLPFISHSGIAGGDVFAAAGAENLAKTDLRFLQTYSFVAPQFPARSEPVVDLYRKMFPETETPAGIVSPSGVAHAYDIVHLLARAIEKAGSADRRVVRESLEHLGRYEGLIRDYDPPFTPRRHDALTAENYFLARFDTAGAIVPEGRR